MTDLQEVGAALAPKHKEPLGYTKAEAQQRGRRILFVLAFVVLFAAYFALGWFWGQRYATDQLPECQEDEVLYPADDYKGPGGNATGDYTCIHIDEF